MHELERISPIRRQALREALYFESLLAEAQRAGLFSDTELEGVQTQLGSLLAAQVRRYTHGESSSVKTETALSIFQSICFLLGVFCKAQSSPEAAVDELRKRGLPELLRDGLELVKAQVTEARERYADVLATRVETPLLSYNDTLDEGIPLFFRDYDREFSAHEIPGMIDYPAYGPPIETVGTEYMTEYLRRLQLDNRFCRAYPPEEIHAALSARQPGYAELLVNLRAQLEECLLPDGTLPEIALEAPQQASVVFESGKKMDDERFRALTEELRSCRHLSDKLAILRDGAVSFSDLLDILEAECFFDAEYEALFLSLEDSGLALLLRASEREGDPDFETFAKKEWQREFSRCLKEMEPQRRARIETLSDAIVVFPSEDGA